MKIRVYYEDTDLGGVVYYANYLKFCERARSEVFFSRGETPIFEGGHFVVRHLEADYKKSARFGDLLDVSVELLELGNTTLLIRQQVFLGDDLLFEMTVKLAYLMLEGGVGRLHAEKKAKLRALFGE
jgi:acyl-CoA thioester hydrolase